MTMGSAAPGRLEVVQAFVNTRNVESGSDAIATPDALARWLRQADLLASGHPVVPSHVHILDEFREALRAALAANHECAGVTPSTLAVLNDAARRSMLSVSFTGSGWAVVPQATGVDAAIGSLLAIVIGSMADGTWSRLKVCVNDACRWAFYDTSRARAGKWCSMGVCGNRAKQQAWRRRRTSTVGTHL